MPQHDYSPSHALNILMDRLDKALPDLAAQIRSTIDMGTVDNVADGPDSRRKKKRYFLKARPFTDEEALAIATDALRAYFVELPACMQAMHSEFQHCEVSGYAREGESREAKVIQVETVPETAKFRTVDREVVSIIPPETALLEQQRHNVLRLRSLLDFN